jgi:membrane-associated PAP2 superfamily phosphatase
MLASVKPADLSVVMVALAVSLFAFDLFRGPAAVFALLVAGAGWVEARRGRAVGRRLLGVFAGMVLAAVAIGVLAFASH